MIPLRRIRQTIANRAMVAEMMFIASQRHSLL